MNGQLASSTSQGTTSAQQYKKKNSTDAMALLDHGCDITLHIAPPVGDKLVVVTKFIGCHSNHTALIEVPNLSDEYLDTYIQEGFWINAKAIGTRGEGATVTFRAQLIHVLDEPYPVLVLKLPSTMLVADLRKEARYEVNLKARIRMNEFSTNGEVRDFSGNGCRFVLPKMSRALNVGDAVSIDVQIGTPEAPILAPLKGQIRNQHNTLHYARYGVEFDGFGRANARDILKKFHFDGAKLTIKNSPY